jgi:hypothetical protein
MHPSCMSLITISHNPWRMSSCHHHDRNDGRTTFRGETINKTHNNQSLNSNGVAATNYKGSRDVRTALDAPLLGSDMIHGPKYKYGVTAPWKVLETQIVSYIPVDSYFSCIWEQSHWKDNLLIFPMSPRTLWLDVVCSMGISCNVDFSWILNWTTLIIMLITLFMLALYML